MPALRMKLHAYAANLRHSSCCPGTQLGQRRVWASSQSNVNCARTSRASLLCGEDAAMMTLGSPTAHVPVRCASAILRRSHRAAAWSQMPCAVRSHRRRQERHPAKSIFYGPGSRKSCLGCSSSRLIKPSIASKVSSHHDLVIENTMLRDAWHCLTLQNSVQQSV